MDHPGIAQDSQIVQCAHRLVSQVKDEDMGQDDAVIEILFDTPDNAAAFRQTLLELVALCGT